MSKDSLSYRPSERPEFVLFSVFLEHMKRVAASLPVQSFFLGKPEISKMLLGLQSNLIFISPECAAESPIKISKLKRSEDQRRLKVNIDSLLHLCY